MTRILVVGAGATGGYFGAKLAQDSRDVTFLVRERRAAELRARGLRIAAGKKVERLQPQVVTAAEISEPYDLILLSVKADALATALADLTAAVSPQTTIVPFLNGIDHVATIDAQFPGSALGAAVKISAQLTSEGTIAVFMPAVSMEIGELDGMETGRLQTAAAALEAPGYDFAVSDHIVTSMWHKWVFISSAAVITCLPRGTIGEVAAVPGGREFAVEVLAETAAVASAAGHALTDAVHASFQAVLTQQESPFTPSLYRDMTDRRLTEVEHVLASLAGHGARYGIATPRLNAAVVGLRLHNASVRAAAASQQPSTGHARSTAPNPAPSRGRARADHDRRHAPLSGGPAERPASEEGASS
jgi:2-dehydropantoate 2-reductase